MGSPVTLTTTRYGWALLTKVALVLTIVAIAAYNRWVFLPRLERAQDALFFKRMLQLEAVLLLVLAATSVLSTSPVPH